jgi:hypothetical protein
VDPRRATRLARHLLEGADAQLGAGGRRALAQPGVEVIPLDHADVAAVDGHVHAALGGGDHARRLDAGAQQGLGNLELAHQLRRDGPAAGFDPAVAVEEQDRTPGAGQFMGRRRPRRSASHDDDIEGFQSGHARRLPSR